MQVSEADREYVPAGQASQVVLKPPPEKVPAVHGVQTLPFVIKPGSQDSGEITKEM